MSEEKKEKKEISISDKPKILERKCPKCGSIISSKILKQCPICDTILEEEPRVISGKKVSREPAVVFTGKKLELADKFILQKDQWKLREAGNVFFNSLVFYIFAEIAVLAFLFMAQTPNNLELPITIEVITLSQIPGAFFIVYPLFYIISKKHNFTKIGLNSKKKSLTIALIIGVFGIFLTYITYLLAIYINDSFVSIGWIFFAPSTTLGEQNQVIRDSIILYKILIIVLIMLDSLGTEITFRGVLHNGLIEKFGSQLIERIYVILIVSSIYTGLFLFFTFDLWLVVANFLISLVYGFIYELSNRNLYATICTNSIFTLITFIMILV
jgi:membrane protease YdiL (CAAX protease family)